MSNKVILADLIRLGGYLDRIHEAGEDDASMKAGWTEANKVFDNVQLRTLNLSAPTGKPDPARFMALRYFVRGLIEGLNSGEDGLRQKVAIL